MRSYIKNYENKSPKDCITGYVKEVIESEFIKVEAAARKRKYTNYACAFLLSGVLAAGICFTVCPLAVAALLFFAIGLYYGANLVLNDVNFSQVGCERAK